MAKTITKAESKRRAKANQLSFPVGGIDNYDGPCECCKREETKGEVFEDSDLAYVCNVCYWTREDVLEGTAAK